MGKTVLLLILALSEITDRESLRFAYSSEQGFDSSCGLAALSCFLNRYWGIPVDEVTLISEHMVDRLATGEFAVSFADMVRILRSYDFVCKAYELDYGQFSLAIERYAPIILHYDKPVGHFALALAMHDGAILTADPAEGMVLLEQAAFEARWSGMVLVAVKPEIARAEEALKTAIDSILGRSELLERAALAGAGAMRW